MAHTHTHMQVISDNGHWARARAVRNVLLVSRADSRTERLRILLTVVTVLLTHIPYPAVVDVGGSPKK